MHGLPISADLLMAGSVTITSASSFHALWSDGQLWNSYSQQPELRR